MHSKLNGTIISMRTTSSSLLYHCAFSLKCQIEDEEDPWNAPMGRVVSHLDALLREAASLMQDIHG